MTTARIGILVLAAGGSTRMGRPKQLLRLDWPTKAPTASGASGSAPSSPPPVREGRGRDRSNGSPTLIHRAAETALAAGEPVVVVIGAEAEPVAAEVRGLPVQIVENRDWSRGMGSSLRLGVQTLIELRPGLAALIIMLCDQVDVTPATLDRLRAAHLETGKGLCGASFDGAIGPPALFSRSYFGELLRLPDASGAKSILLGHPADLVRVACPEAARDLDTWEQYERASSPTD
jgi:molybdenum cofactor cytidylyltransferase